MRSRPLPKILSVTAAAVLTTTLAACAGAPESDTASDDTNDSSTGSAESAESAAFPAEVTACGHTTTVDAPPESAVTLNQGATEVMLALGLEESMAGTAYLDEAIAEQWQDAYDTVPVLSEEYPTNEEFLAAEPDFAYASYVSAFDPKVAGTQAELDDLGIASYLSPFGCEDDAERAEPTFDAVWAEIEDIGTLFGVGDVAEDVVADQQATLAELEESAPGEGLSAVWYDSGTKTPLVGAGGSGPELVMDSVGLENVFADLDGGWADGSWEDVVATDPDVIIVVDAAWDSAQSKIEYLRSDPVLSELTAVAEDRLVTVSYAEGTPGVRMVDGVATVAEQVEALGLQ